MKVVTFNIRCDYGQDGLNEFVNRKELILRKINQSKNCYDRKSTFHRNSLFKPTIRIG